MENRVATEVHLEETAKAARLYTETKLREVSDILIDAMDSGYASGGGPAEVKFKEFSISADKWKESVESHIYPYYTDMPVSGIRDTDNINVILSPETQALGIRFYNIIEIGNGSVRIRAADRPLEEVSGSYSINTLMVLSAIDDSILDVLNADFGRLRAEVQNEINTMLADISLSTGNLVDEVSIGMQKKVDRMELQIQNSFSGFGELVDTTESFFTEIRNVINNTVSDLSSIVLSNIEASNSRLNALEDLIMERVGQSLGSVDSALGELENYVKGDVDGEAFQITFGSDAGLHIERGSLDVGGRRIEC